MTVTSDAADLSRALLPHLEWLRRAGVTLLPAVPGPSSLVPGPEPACANPGPWTEDPSPAAPAAGLDAVRREAEACTKCRLCEGRTTVVFEDGSREAPVMFIGEGPGAEEDRQGLPFVGPAGQLLTRILLAMGLRRDEVYIANIVKCRPPGNRTPEPDEVAACLPYLRAQIAAVRPRAIVLLGSVAARALVGPEVSITRIRGRFTDVDGIPAMPTFHPAYLLRNPGEKRKVWEDVQKVRDLVRSSRPDPLHDPPPPTPPPAPGESGPTVPGAGEGAEAGGAHSATGPEAR
ncbi:MAG: uracil-DNA glycosylase [Planctomycetales bacterium]|nr:uracil-DNA glycosylase [Planctomycetales bacterium]